MKVLFSILMCISFIGFSQNKKEQISILDTRIDSLKTVVFSMSNEIQGQSISIDSLYKELQISRNETSALQLKLTETEKKVTLLEQERFNRIRCSDLETVNYGEENFSFVEIIKCSFRNFQIIDSTFNSF